MGAILAVVVGEVGRQDARVEHRSDKAHQAEWEILNIMEERERRLTLSLDSSSMFSGKTLQQTHCLNLEI